MVPCREWCRVQVDEGAPAWVASRYLREGSDGGSVVVPRLNVRPFPGISADSPPLGQLVEEQVVRVIRAQDEWSEIGSPDTVSLWALAEELRAAVTAD